MKRRGIILYQWYIILDSSLSNEKTTQDLNFSRSCDFLYELSVFTNNAVQEKCGCTANCVAEKIQPGKGSAHQNGEEPVICQTEQGNQIKVLPELHQGGKEKYEEWQQPYFAGDNYAAQTAKQQGNKHIAHIRADKSVMDEQRNADLYGQ